MTKDGSFASTIHEVEEPQLAHEFKTYSYQPFTSVILAALPAMKLRRSP